MTKNEELYILSKAAADLGTDSYLGPWLTSIIGELERDLRSDFLPVLSLFEARYRADNALREAQVICEQRLQDAQTKADKIVQEAVDSANRIRSAVRNDLQRALDSVR